MSATRLLVLGVIRILQPVHGYDVRRELLTWRLDERTNVKPGSIYAAIRTLEKDGAITVHAHEAGASGPDRTTYVVTREGEKEFQLLLREAWWAVKPPLEPLLPALSLFPFLPREELIAALRARVATLEAQLESMAFMRASIRDGASGADGEVPEHVREIIDFTTARTRAEVEWARELQRRLRAGAYVFAGEEGFPEPQPGQGIQDALPGSQA